MDSRKQRYASRLRVSSLTKMTASVPGRSARTCRRTLVATSLMVSMVVLAACGGGGGNVSGASSGGSQGDSVVARVGTTAITRTEVNHWMSTLAGGDYYEVTHGHTVPKGLVSDPPRYSECVAELEATADAAPVRTSQPSSVELLEKCRQLHRALRLQAVTLLVDIELIFVLAAEEGASATDKEVLAAYDKSTAERFPSRSALARSQAARRISVSDEVLLFRKDLLASKLLAKLKSRGGLKALSRLEARWTSKIDCQPGYVVGRCKQFRGEPPPSPSSPPAAVLMEQVGALATGRCADSAACAKQ